MSTISSAAFGGATSCESTKSELAQIQQKIADRLNGGQPGDSAGDKGQVSSARKIDDVVDLSKRDDRVAATARADFGASFDGFAAGRRVDITA